ncbi:hypothetical protein Q7P36_008863 [Cladosporium allicinum]
MLNTPSSLLLSFLIANHRHHPHHNYHSPQRPARRLLLNTNTNTNNSNNNNTTTTTTTMSSGDPNKMPEFKLIDGWYVTVSGPVYNPAAAASERAVALATAATTPGGLVYMALPAPAYETRAPAASNPSTATVENDCSGTVGDGSEISSGCKTACGVCDACKERKL